MSLVPRLVASLLAVGGATAVVAASLANADPDIDGESAAAVINQLQQQGYAVNVNGAPAGDTSLLTTCTVTSIHNPADPTPDPTTTTTIYVDVACPLTHG
ncbi:MAG: hypothetical protein JWR13_1551 [Mycobacterium sp.]|jgi:hypothetical protein|nr:hypothetical protein [Mycobacterium sp.]MCW2730735.1 hypothetical protein [Mycobacterium sp.]MDT5072497.1 hypothetical protein [Mycobacterium sp.]MDT5317071.1 hypothetical protein [Mycobacterium sp.]